MKPRELPRNAPVDRSFFVDHIVADRFLNVWHCHEQLELVYIKRSTGTKFIGDSITPFNEGSLVLIGSYLPHLWLSDPGYSDPHGDTAESFSLFFSPDCFGDQFFNIPELRTIKKTLELAQRGLEIEGPGKKEILRLMEQLQDLPDPERIIGLLTILRLIVEDTDREVLSSQSFVSTYHRVSSSRLDKVYEYVLNNFKQEIALEKIADVVSMNPSSFSRYFKKKTSKNFTAYLSEVRVGYACKLFNDESDKNISEIAYECGFNNISNFNKQFKALKGLTPSEYIKTHQKASASIYV